MRKIAILLTVTVLGICVYALAEQSAERPAAKKAVASSMGIKKEVPTKEDEASVLYRDAVALYWDGRYNEARAKFEETAKVSPGHSRTNYYLEKIKEKLTAGYKSAGEVARTGASSVKKVVEAQEKIVEEEAIKAKLESDKIAREEAVRKEKIENERAALALKAREEEDARKAREESEAKAKMDRERKSSEKMAVPKVVRKQNFSHKKAPKESTEVKKSTDVPRRAREESKVKAKVESERKAAEKPAEKPAQSSAPTDIKAPLPASAAEKPGMAKVKIDVSQKIIDQQMAAYNGNLKAIVSEAESNLKKIDGELKSQKSEEVVNSHLKAADAYKAEGKIDEAKAEFKAAMVAANTPAMKKSIKEKERSIDKQSRGLGVKAKKDAKAQEPAAKSPREEVKKVKAKIENDSKPAVEAAPKARLQAEAPAPKKAVQGTESENRPSPVAAVAAKSARPIVPGPKAPVATKQIATPATAKPAVPAQVKLPEDEVSILYKEAVTLYWDNKPKEAMAKFDKVQKMSPGYARSSYYMDRLKGKTAR